MSILKDSCDPKKRHHSPFTAEQAARVIHPGKTKRGSRNESFDFQEGMVE